MSVVAYPDKDANEKDVPIYVDYPIAFQVELEVTGESFATDVIVGLENADSSKRCIIGTLSFDHVVSDPELIDSPETLYNGSYFHVPPKNCSQLAGEHDVKAWVAFDPFGKVNLIDRPLPEPKERQTVEEYVQNRRLDDQDCGDNCSTKLNVENTPGRDLILSSVNLSSNLASLQVDGIPYLPKIPAGTTGPTGADIKSPDLSAYTSPQSTTPTFILSTEVTLFGGDGQPAIKPGDAQISVRLRPNMDALEVGSAEVLDDDFQKWMPVSVEVVAGSKDGSTTVQSLQSQLLGQLVDAQTAGQQAALYIDGATKKRIVDGVWKPAQVYDMEICVRGNFDENNGRTDESAKENNCVVEQVQILRDVIPTTYGGISDPDNAPNQTNQDDDLFAGAAAEMAFNQSTEVSLGDPKKQEMRLKLSGGVRGQESYFDVGGNVVMSLLGWVALTVGDVDIAFRDYVDRTKDDEFRLKASFLNSAFLKTFPMKDDTYKEIPLITETDKDGKETSEIKRDSPKYSFSVTYIVTLNASMQFSGTMGAKATLEKTSRDKGCTPGIEKESGNYCYGLTQSAGSIDEVRAMCRDRAAFLAAPKDKAEYDLLDQIRKDNQQSHIWTDFANTNKITKSGDAFAFRGSCKDLQKIAADAKSKNDSKQFQSVSSAIAECQEGFKSLSNLSSHWVSLGGQDAIVADADVTWAPNEPNDDTVIGEGYAAMQSSGLVDLNKFTRLQGICKRPNGATGELKAVLKPYAKVTAKYEASVSILVLSAGIRGDSELVSFEMPHEAGLGWVHTPELKRVDAYLYTLAKAKMNVLKTKLDAFYKFDVWVYSKESSFNILDWGGFPLPEKTFWDTKTPMLTLKY